MKNIYISIISLVFTVFISTAFPGNSKSIKYTGAKADSLETLNDTDLPSEYHLYQNYPNPFNPTTEIKYSLPEKDHVVLRVYNTLGIVIATLVDEVQPAGTYKVSFDGKDLFSGMYFYRLQMNDFVKVRKMILLK